MRKCPLCNKKIPEDSKFCPECGWDLTEHELTLPQIARIQEEIQDARFKAMQWHVATVPFAAVGLVCILVYMFAAFGAIPGTWDFMFYVALAIISVEIAAAFFRDRHKKKQDRLKMILRSRLPSQ
jgi:hypothetical protein